MLGGKLQHSIAGKGLRKKFAVFGMVVLAIVLIGSASWGFYLYKLSKTDCTKVTQEAKQSLQSKQFSDAYDTLKSNKRACSKDITKQKTNSQKITTMSYEAALAKSAFESGDKDTAKEHIRKSINSLRKIDLVKISDAEKKSLKDSPLTADQIFDLDYELYKNPDGSYEGYND